MKRSRRNLWILMILAIVIIFMGSTIFSGCKEETAPGEETVEEEKVAEEESEVKQFEGQELLISGSTTLLPFAEPAAAAFMEQYGGSITIAGGGSGTGVSECINEINDIANSSRRVESEEIEEAQSMGIELVEVLVAYDGISIILSGNIEGVGELSIRQLSDIFRGIITNWSDVEGPDAEIILGTWPRSAGTAQSSPPRAGESGSRTTPRDFTPMVL